MSRAAVSGNWSNNDLGTPGYPQADRVKWRAKKTSLFDLNIPRMGKGYCLILNEFKKNYRGPNCLNSALNDADFARCTSTKHGFSVVTHFASKKTANLFKPTNYARHSMKAREGHRSMPSPSLSCAFLFPANFQNYREGQLSCAILADRQFPN